MKDRGIEGQDMENKKKNFSTNLFTAVSAWVFSRSLTVAVLSVDHEITKSDAAKKEHKKRKEEHKMHKGNNNRHFVLFA